MRATFAETDAGWVADPAGEAFESYHEAGGLVWLQCVTRPDVAIAVPKSSLPVASPPVAKPSKSGG